MTLPDVVFGPLRIGAGQRPIVIAEMSGNHNQSLERALAIVDAAAEAGAHVLKLQTYTADTMTIPRGDAEFLIDDPGSLWKGSTLHQLYQKAHTPWEWHKPIFERCAARGMVAFSSPFDASAIDFLEQLNVPGYKIASFENADLELIHRAASTGKPLIISTGMATVSELEDAVGAARAAGCRHPILLKCTSTYPATPASSNLRTIPHLRDLFGTHVGLSDHTLGVGASVAAVAMGACVVEKHFTLDRRDGGVDSTFSLEPHELKSLVVETERAWLAMGEVSYGPTDEEQKSVQFRRSLYVVRAIKAGELFTEENLRAIRPGNGLPPKHRAQFLGRVARRDLSAGTALSWDMLG